MASRKSFLLIILVIILIVFYIGYSFSGRGKIVFVSDFKNANVSPQLKSYKPGETIKIEYPLNVGKPRQSIFRPLLGAKLIISTELENVSSVVYSQGKKVKSGEILQRSNSGMQYRQVKYDIPFSKRGQTFTIKGKVPGKAKQKITFAHIVIRKRYLFESADRLTVLKKGWVR